MKVIMSVLNDTQRLVMESGIALAKELGLTPLEETRKTREVTLVAVTEAEKALAKRLGLTEESYTIKEDIEFFDGQTILLASPVGTKVGVIKTVVREDGKTRSTKYTMNDELLFRTEERLRGDKWEKLFNADLNIPDYAVIYGSEPR
jgi:hypothetical protein